MTKKAASRDISVKVTGDTSGVVEDRKYILVQGDEETIVSKEEFDKYVALNKQWMQEIARLCTNDLLYKYREEANIDIKDKIALIDLAKNQEESIGFLTHYYYLITRADFSEQSYNFGAVQKVPSISKTVSEFSEWSRKHTPYRVEDDQFGSHTHTIASLLANESYAQSYASGKALTLIGIIENRFSMYTNTLILQNQDYWNRHRNTSFYPEVQMMRRLGTAFGSVVTNCYCDNKINPEAFYNASKSLSEFMLIYIGKLNDSIRANLEYISSEKLMDTTPVVYSSPRDMFFPRWSVSTPVRSKGS